MKLWPDLTHFAGFDWASDHHDVVVVDKAGTVVLEFRFEQSGKGWQEFTSKTKEFPALGVAIETSSGAAVERLVAGDYTVFPINPKKAKCYRERKAPSGVKSDRLDAWSQADALRLDGHTWKALGPQDPLILQLRTICRDEVSFIEQRTALVNQLQAALHEYYPTALEAFDDWTRPSSWAFVEIFPTPKQLVEAGKREWEKFLHAHRLYSPKTAEARLVLFAKATEFSGSEPTTAAKSLLAVALVKVLKTVQAQLELYRAEIEILFAKHPDHDIFSSLPGPGLKVLPRLLGEIGSDRTRFDDAQGLQCYAGTAPVTIRSGKKSRTCIRRGCSDDLRASVHWLSDLSRHKSAWAAAYYDKKKEEGKSHAAALRCLGHRWLKILWKMWQTRTPYDAELHLRNQTKHGSWVIQLLSEGAAAVAT